MKKILAILTAVMLMAGMFTVAGAEGEKVSIRLAGLKGPTSMGMVKLLDDAEKGLTENNYVFQMAGSADEVTPGL